MQELQDYLFWRPDPWIWPFSLIGLDFYKIMMWLALGTGTLIWILLGLKWKLKWHQYILSVIAIGVIATITTKLTHVFVYSFDYYWSHPFALFKLHQGKSVHGTMLGFAIFAVLFARKMKLPLHEVADNLSWWIPVGLIFTRLGNFWASEIYGTETTLPWGVRFFNTGDHGTVVRHPVQLYEGAYCILMVLAMIIATKLGARKRPWFMTIFVLLSYNAGRFLADFVKVCPVVLEDFWLTRGQAMSLVFFGLGIYLLVNKRHLSRSCDSDTVR